jgi:ABC-type glycerol-3-phosphate transport system permease component
MMVPFQSTIIPAYLITGRLGLIDSYWGLALPQCSTIVGISYSRRASTRCRVR